MKRIRLIYYSAIILIFFLFLLSPIAGSFLGISSQIDNTERRKLSPIPTLSLQELSSFPKKFEDFFRDNFGFRNLMIKAYSTIKLQLLNSTPNYERGFRVIIGKNGWLFLNPVPGDHLKNFYKNVDFTPTQLAAVKNYLEEDKRKLAEKNIPYFVVIVPDKEAVYTEYYPYPNQIITSRRLDQLVSYLANNSTVDFLDLRQPLINAKDKFPAYYHTDTHWNNYGAFIAYQEIIRRLTKYYPNISTPQLSDFEVTLQNYKISVGDLGNYLHLTEKYQDFGVKFKLKNTQLTKTKLSSVIVYGDSFAETRHYAPKDRFLQEFPDQSFLIPLLFKKSDIENHLIAIGKIEELIPIIEKNVPDKYTQVRLKKWLVNNGILDEYIVGLDYFLPFSFEKLILSAYPPIYYPQISEEKPQLVIRELVERFVDNLAGINHEGPI